MKFKTMAMLVLVLLFSVIAMAATLPPTPMPKAQFFDNAGRPLSGGKVYTYSAGTTTPKATYTDSTGTVPNANPVILDSAGRASIWLNGNYKFIVKDRNDYQLYTSDNVSSMPYTDTSLSFQSSQWIALTNVPTYLSTTSFSLTSDQTGTFQQGRRYKATIAGGTVYGTVVSSSYGAGLTTITVINDSMNLNSGLSAVSIGTLSPLNHTLPVIDTLDLTGNYTVTNADFGKTIVCNGTSTITISLPTSTSIAPGSYLFTKNTSTWPVILNETIDAVSSPTLNQYNEIRVFGDGTSYYGKVVKGSNEIVPGFLSYQTYSYTASIEISSGSSDYLATTPSVSVTAGDIFLVNASSIMTRGGSAAGVSLIQVYSYPTPTMVSFLVSSGSVSFFEMRKTLPTGYQDTFSSMLIGNVLTTGSIALTMGGISYDDSTTYADNRIQIIFLKRQ